jgi:biotin carboxyl carrier protein
MEHAPYKAIVNGQFEYENLDLDGLDAIPSGVAGKFHILHKQKSFHAEVIDTVLAEKRAIIKINGNVYEVHLQDAMDQLVNRLGLSVKKSHKVKTIKSPMPGLVRRIDVTPGQQLMEGEPVLILEAMKMENVLKSPGEGKVAKVLVSPDTPVDKGQILIEFE